MTREKRKQYGLKLRTSIIEEIDRKRGDASRTYWIECALMLALSGEPDPEGVVSTRSLMKHLPLAGE